MRPLLKVRKSNSKDKPWRVITITKLATAPSVRPLKTVSRPLLKILMNHRAIRTNNKIKVKKVTKVIRIITIQKT